MNPARNNVSLAMKAIMLLILAAGCAVAANPAAAPPAANQALEIDTWIRGLADESFRVREQSSRRLWELGEAALPALKQASEAADPEQAVRARELIRNIRLHIRPDTDPAVIDLVERYAKASTTEKISLLGKLRGKRAWHQMLKLYAGEDDAEVRRKMRAIMAATAVRAARERLAQDDPAGARELLEMAPADRSTLLALAEFHRSQGTLDAEIQRATAAPKPNAAWLLALRRAHGDPVAARVAATAANEPRVAALMAALAGDPLPWLQDFQNATGDDHPAKHYAVIAAKRWSGRKISPADLDPLIRKASSRDGSEFAAAITALFLSGESAAAEKAYRQREPLAAFSYYESIERAPEALEALGLDPAQPAFQPWIEARIDRLLAPDIEDQHEVANDAEELVALANFLERRGQHETLDKAFGAPLAHFAAKDPGAFTEFLGQLFGVRNSPGTAPGLAWRTAVAWAGEDDDRWQDVVVAAIGDDDLTRQWWDWLGEIQPRATRAERLAAALALYRMGSDPQGLRGKWLDSLWRNIAQAPADQQSSLVSRIAVLALETGDVATSLKAWDMLPAAGREGLSLDHIIAHLTTAGRWNEAAELILAQIARMPNAGHESSANLHAYAAAALRMAGRTDDAATHDLRANRLALGNSPAAIRIANAYAFGGDYQRAADWWKRAAMWVDPDSSDCALALKAHADELLSTDEWQTCAAVSEVLAAIHAGSEYDWVNPLPAARLRMHADMARAFVLLPRDGPRALAMLARCHRDFASDGALADYFFPALRRNGLLREHDQWFQQTWQLMQQSLRLYPDADNTLNTAAWFAARSMRRLDDAARLIRKAISHQPEQAAYLDTMAEIQFARGDRVAALEWSAKALMQAPDDPLLRRQHARFRHGPPPE